MTTLKTMSNGSAVALSEEAKTALRATFRGAILYPDSPEYGDARAIWNAMIDRRPGLILRPTGTADVVRAVRFAREHDVLFSIRGGGHNIAGLSLCEGGMLIDLSLMRGVWVDPKTKTARAQAGCTLGDVDRETQLHGLAAVLGFVSQTGIAGLTLGGGFGYLSRQFGWTSDTVLSMEIVTADGNVIRAAEDENADLFWALRGGGGNFGIVTSFEYRLFPIGPEILGGAIAWNGEDAKGVLSLFSEITKSAPRELTLVGALRIAPPAPWLPKEIHGKPMVAIFVCYSGASIEEGEKVLAPLRAFGKPVADIVMRRPYTQMQSLLDATQPKGRRYYWKSHYLPKTIDPAALDVAVTHLASIPSPHSGILFFQLGGKIAEKPADHSPVGNRDAGYVINVASSWEKADADAANIAWTRQLFEATRSFSTGGTYVNFLTEDDGSDRIEAAYGRPTLDKLSALKKTFDPKNIFRHTKSVLV